MSAAECVCQRSLSVTLCRQPALTLNRLVYPDRVICNSVVTAQTHHDMEVNRCHTRHSHHTSRIYQCSGTW